MILLNLQTNSFSRNRILRIYSGQNSNKFWLIFSCHVPSNMCLDCKHFLLRYLPIYLDNVSFWISFILSWPHLHVVQLLSVFFIQNRKFHCIHCAFNETQITLCQKSYFCPKIEFRRNSVNHLILIFAPKFNNILDF